MRFTQANIDNALDNIWFNFNTDDSGYLEKQEAINFFNFLFNDVEDFELTDDDRNDLLKWFDGNGDGKISREEMRNFLLEL